MAGQHADQTGPVAVSCEIGDSGDKEGSLTTAAVAAAAVRPELHLAGGQH